jgi:hypothetical protein
MMQIAANISGENSQERSIGCARKFPFDTCEKRSDQQHGGYPSSGLAVRSEGMAAFPVASSSVR